MLAHSRRLRRGRVSESGRIYLITTTTHDRRPIFRDLTLGREVVRSLRAEAPRAETMCFVVMPDHLHWLIQLVGDARLSSVMRNVKAGSATRIRKLIGSNEQVWQAGFHDRALRKEENIRDVARYVVANPLRARLVQRLGDYPLWDAIWI